MKQKKVECDARVRFCVDFFCCIEKEKEKSAISFCNKIKKNKIKESKRFRQSVNTYQEIFTFSSSGLYSSC